MANPKQSTPSQSKLTPAQIQTTEIQDLLQAPLQMGTNKFLINVNGQSSKIKTNKNAIVKYTLEQPIKLDIGDRVTLIESFVEERGLSIDTISFEDDVEEAVVEEEEVNLEDMDCKVQPGVTREDLNLFLQAKKFELWLEYGSFNHVI